MNTNVEGILLEGLALILFGVATVLITSERRNTKIVP